MDINTVHVGLNVHRCSCVYVRGTVVYKYNMAAGVNSSITTLSLCVCVCMQFSGNLVKIVLMTVQTCHNSVLLALSWPE